MLQFIILFTSPEMFPVTTLRCRCSNSATLPLSNLCFTFETIVYVFVTKMFKMVKLCNYSIAFSYPVPSAERVWLVLFPCKVAADRKPRWYNWDVWCQPHWLQGVISDLVMLNKNSYLHPPRTSLVFPGVAWICIERS